MPAMIRYLDHWAAAALSSSSDEADNASIGIGTVIPHQRNIRTQWLPLLIFVLVWDDGILLFRYTCRLSPKSLKTEASLLLRP
ncbi:hypothetical protein TNCV_3542751 [Trichonephila clavipes]|nr:hypothetical protein TNCV_3542751 [Trichonephila clavipes]